MKTRLHPRLLMIVALTLTVVVLAACYPPTNLSVGGAPAGATSTGTGPATMNTLEGDWQLVTVGGAPAIAGSEATMLLAGGAVTGTTGCNRYNGSYTLSGTDGIKFGPLASTMMACVGPVMVQEQAFNAALTATTAYSLSGEVLTFKDAAGKELATFKPRVSTSLSGSTWVATGINNGRQAVQSVVTGTEVTAVFGADGILSGNAGCNTYSAAYTVDGSNMTIKAPASTRMFCAEPAGVMEQEAAYLAALAQVATYRIDGNRLELRAADGALQAGYTAKQ